MTSIDQGSARVEDQPSPALACQTDNRPRYSLAGRHIIAVPDDPGEPGYQPILRLLEAWCRPGTLKMANSGRASPHLLSAVTQFAKDCADRGKSRRKSHCIFPLITIRFALGSGGGARPRLPLVCSFVTIYDRPGLAALPALIDPKGADLAKLRRMCSLSLVSLVRASPC